VFQEAGYEVEIASTEGGRIEMDGYSNPMDASGYSAHDVITLGYMQQKGFMDMLSNTKSITDAGPARYDAVFLVGGQAPMYTFRGNKNLERLFSDFYESGKSSAAVCHSTTLLLDARGSNGELPVKGRSWTGFANAEEDFADKAVGMRIQPYRIEDEARKLKGTNFKVAGAFSSYAIRDGNFITGQQQNSGEAAARLLVEALAK
jgi:putative intracellular protease/amidase